MTSKHKQEIGPMFSKQTEIGPMFMLNYIRLSYFKYLISLPCDEGAAFYFIK